MHTATARTFRERLPSPVTNIPSMPGNVIQSARCVGPLEFPASAELPVGEMAVRVNTAVAWLCPGVTGLGETEQEALAEVVQLSCTALAKAPPTEATVN